MLQARIHTPKQPSFVPPGQLAQLQPQLEKLQQQSEAMRAELQATKSGNSSLSQQVADLEAAAAMHLAHQVSQQNSSSQPASEL